MGCPKALKEYNLELEKGRGSADITCNLVHDTQMA